MPLRTLAKATFTDLFEPNESADTLMELVDLSSNDEETQWLSKARISLFVSQGESTVVLSAADIRRLQAFLSSNEDFIALDGVKSTYTESDYNL